MGAKTAMLAFTDGDLRPALLGATRCDPAEAEELVRRIHPGYDVTPIGDGTLFYDTDPPDDITYAAVLTGAELLCDGRLVFDRPSQLPEHLRRAGAGRRIVMHGMHSVYWASEHPVQPEPGWSNQEPLSPALSPPRTRRGRVTGALRLRHRRLSPS